jgi:hypothetical protein
MNGLSQSYNKILEVLRTIEPNENFLNQIRKSKLSDIELIALDICAEYMSIDSECQLFRCIPESISSKIERSVYNRRRRGLVLIKEGLRKQMARIITPNEDYLVIDSMPLEVCKLSRSSRAKVCKENFDTAPDKGFCASQNTWFYGYKLHAVFNIQGVF